jgi:hypothetical protein
MGISKGSTPDKKAPATLQKSKVEDEIDSTHEGGASQAEVQDPVGGNEDFIEVHESQGEVSVSDVGRSIGLVSDIDYSQRYSSADFGSRAVTRRDGNRRDVSVDRISFLGGSTEDEAPWSPYNRRAKTPMADTHRLLEGKTTEESKKRNDGGGTSQ